MDEKPVSQGLRGSEDAAPLASKAISEQARRALEEAEQRRAIYRKREAERPREIGGRGGSEPGRYGDWEVKGIATDF